MAWKNSSPHGSQEGEGDKESLELQYPSGTELPPPGSHLFKVPTASQQLHTLGTFSTWEFREIPDPNHSSGVWGLSAQVPLNTGGSHPGHMRLMALPTTCLDYLGYRTLCPKKIKI